MLETLVCFGLFYGIALGLNCVDIPEPLRCDDGTPCMRIDNPVKEACGAFNGAGCSAGYFYCPTNAASNIIGTRCGVKGCDIGTCQNNDISGACHFPRNDGSCYAGTIIIPISPSW